MAQAIDLIQDQVEPNILSKFKEIKKKNELLKATIYSQFWKLIASSQHTLISAFDTEKGKMQITCLQALVPFPNTPADYKNSIFSFDVNQIHPIDQMDMHKQTGEMLYSILTNTAMTTSRLQASVSNIQSQLKLEKISSLAKDTNIKSPEDLVIKLGYDPSDVKVAEEIVRRKNEDIAALKKQPKLPSIEYPWTKEVGEPKKQKEEMFKIIIKQKSQIKDMEVRWKNC